MLRLLLLFLLSPLVLGAARVPSFTQNIVCPPVRVRLPAGVSAEPQPALESYRYWRQAGTGPREEFDGYVPEQLWRQEQRLGAWRDAAGNRYELVVPKSRLGGPWPREHVTREEYAAARQTAGSLERAALGDWLGDWLGQKPGAPQGLKGVGAVRQGFFAVTGEVAALVFFLSAEPEQPYALLVRPADGEPAAWKNPLTRALAGMAPAGKTFSGTVQTAAGWTTLERPPYRVLSDLGSRNTKTLETLLSEMQAVRKAYAVVFPEPKGTQVPVSVIRVFSSPSDYHAYVGQGMEWSAGVFSSVHRELVVMGDDAEKSNRKRREDIRQITFHEGFHQYLFLVTPSTVTLPTWFNEGHATYFETCHIRGGVAKPGLSPRLEIARPLVGARSPEGLAKLMSASREVFYGPARNDAYAMAWLVVYWLRTETTPPLSTALDRYYALLCAGKTSEEAQTAVFPPSVLDEISQGLSRFLEKHN